MYLAYVSIALILSSFCGLMYMAIRTARAREIVRMSKKGTVPSTPDASPVHNVAGASILSPMVRANNKVVAAIDIQTFNHVLLMKRKILFKDNLASLRDEEKYEQQIAKWLETLATRQDLQEEVEQTSPPNRLPLERLRLPRNNAHDKQLFNTCAV
ncbi:hypothetical protein G5S35_08095 [Paraburkholderia tropica]|uniref:hypothetical protein n=1 Tax=Paraburkholderia tropica TaxID=92647 RepID=UPI001601DE1B|nr:hypothetical protein [Paraburkholderia tropica]QNB11543.1 hypothetical protein G5S35_08095 [Paraburkholderia tropica]